VNQTLLSLLMMNLTTLRFRYFWDAHPEWNPEDPNVVFKRVSLTAGRLNSGFIVFQTQKI